MKSFLVVIGLVITVIGILLRFSYILFGILIPHHRLLGYGVIAVGAIIFVYGLVAKTTNEKTRSPT